MNTPAPAPRKGLLLAGGLGTRLRSLTGGGNKHLLTVHDRPMLLHALATLLRVGVREVLIVTTPVALPDFRRLLGDGSRLGLRLAYAEQPRPEGVAQVFPLAVACGFLRDGDPSVLALGDSLFFGPDPAADLRRIAAGAAGQGSTVLAVPVADGRAYGCVRLAPDGRPLSIEEKPAVAGPALAVPGLYFYDGDAPAHVRSLAPSARGELEITDLNRRYLAAGRLRVEPLPDGLVWRDAGTPETLVEAARLAARHPSPPLDEIAAAAQAAFSGPSAAPFFPA